MSTIRMAIDVRATPAALFALTQDYDRRLAWDPFLKEARLLNQARQPAVGVRAWCVARSGLGMETEYVSFQDPRVAAVRMTRGPRLLAAFAGAWHFQALDATTTRVRFIYHLRAWPRWLGWLLGPILHGVFARDTHRRLLALKRAAESTPWPQPPARP